MGLTRNMRRDREPVRDTVMAGPREDALIGGAKPYEFGHVAPHEASRRSLARTVHGIIDPQTLPVEPVGPLLGIVMDTQARVGRPEKIDVVAESEEAASQQGADLAKQVLEIGRVANLQEIQCNAVRRIKCRHTRCCEQAMRFKPLPTVRPFSRPVPSPLSRRTTDPV